MLTRMTDADWTIALEVFRAVRSRRGDKGRDDRRFLEALHYFTVQSVTWRTLPAEFGNWNSIWKRFWRLRENGTIDAFFEALAELSPTADFVQMFDSTVVRAHVSAAGAKGGSRIRRSAARGGGFSTKIHLKTDFSGLPLAFVLTGGEAGDSPQFETLLDIGSDVRPRAAVTDKGYDSKRNRAAAASAASLRSFPAKPTPRRDRLLSKSPLPDQARIEQTFGKLKRFKRIAFTLREDQSELRSVRLPRPRIHPHQIRPHDLVASLAGEDRLQWYAQNLLMMREETLRLARRTSTSWRSSWRPNDRSCLPMPRRSPHRGDRRATSPAGLSARPAPLGAVASREVRGLMADPADDRRPQRVLVGGSVR